MILKPENPSLPTDSPLEPADLWLGGMAIAIPALLYWTIPAVADALPRNADLPIHASIETLYVAGATAIFSIAWHAPRNSYRLRPTLVACLCIPLLVFSLLHSVAYPGMPDLFGNNSPQISFRFGVMARLALPFILATIALAPRATVLSKRLRWGMLATTLGLVLLFAWIAVGYPGDLPADENSTPSKTSIHSALAGLFLLTALISGRCRDTAALNARYLTLSALLAAIAELCFIPDTDSLGAFGIVGHIYALLGLGTACIATYGEAVAGPFQDLEKSRTAALLDKERVETVLRSIADGVVVVDRQLAVISMNPVARQLISMSGEAVPGSDFGVVLDAIDPGGASSLAQDIETCLCEGRARKTGAGYTLRSRTGGNYVVEHSVSPISGQHGRVLGAVVVLRDITDMQQVHLQLEFQATFDALTALPNRRLFRQRIEEAMARARRSGHLIAVMFIDLDDFKDVNDSLGHGIGDDLLKGIATRVLDSLRETDTVARIGGDEFGVLVDDLLGVEDIQLLADKLLNVVAAPLLLEGNEVTVSCSIGISLFPLDPGDVDTLLRNADTAVFRAKESGKNNYRCYTADMNAEVQHRVHLGNRMRNAVRQLEFELHYQPQVNLANGTPVGVEALIRWNAEGLGPVSPADFIPIAEATGLILQIGEWVLYEACRQAASWYREGCEILVAVNISARQFRDSDIVGIVLRILDETGLPARLLELELTESMLMRDAPRAAETLGHLKNIGVHIAIDDFGTGYSSLSYLKSFPLDHLKVDRSFVADIHRDQKDKAIVRSIVTLAHNLGLKVIAEGVETIAQLAFLQELGCDEIQGYFVSRPRPAGELPGLWRDYGYQGSALLPLQPAM